MHQTSGEIRAYLDTMPVVDVHTHLGMFGRYQARNFADIVAYHWLGLELIRAHRAFCSRMK